MPDVTKDFSSEIIDGGKDASSNDLPLDFGEPDFDLVKPGRVSGCKMNADLGMIGQKVVDEFGFMGREIISDNMDLASEGLGGHHLGKKVDELGAGMALSSLAKDFSASGIQGSVERKGAVAVILETMSLGPARRKGQNRIQTVQGLDSSLFVYAKDGGMIRRVQIQANNVGGLLLEVGILAQHVTAQPVRLKAVPSPHPRKRSCDWCRGRRPTDGCSSGWLRPEDHDGSTPKCAPQALPHRVALCDLDDGRPVPPDDL